MKNNIAKEADNLFRILVFAGVISILAHGLAV